MIVSSEDPDRCPVCGDVKLRQEEDVLDTWFSSALWPFATLGWPLETEELKYFYPTSLLVTSHDIIFFWVARMMMMGLHFMRDIPFDDVYIHALVRDEQGRKMSKSRGNVIDPLDVIEEFGTDALRFTLSSMATPGRDIFLSRERIEGNRNFANKLWNASRFVLMNLEGFERIVVKEEEFTLADRWIFSRMNNIVSQVEDSLRVYNVAEASRLIYDFFWSDYADWYIELAKPRLYQKDDPRQRLVAQNLLVEIMDVTLRLLHPFMPFITEEIWQKFPGTGESIVIAPWPRMDGSRIDMGAESQMDVVQRVTSSIRAIKSVLGIALTKPVTALLKTTDADKQAILEKDASYIKELAWVEELIISPDITKPEHAAVDVAPGVEIFIPLAGLVDIEEEKKRLGKELAKTQTDAEKTRKKLSNPQFMEKAAPEVVEKEKAKLIEFDEKISKLTKQLESL
ncbi:MAG TPA: hypothetical protein DE036_10410 [Actinobacteria bacterium]|nr:hypothetical protein [Actinomycetota bacterium]